MVEKKREIYPLERIVASMLHVCELSNVIVHQYFEYNYFLPVLHGSYPGIPKC